MKASQRYGGVILTALTDGSKHRDHKALRDHIGAMMDLYDDFSRNAGESNVLVQTDYPTKIESSSSFAVPSTLPDLPDIGERVIDNRQYSLDEIQQMKGDLNRRYQAELPTTINIQPPGFDHTIVLNRGPIASQPGDMPNLKIMYAPPGAQTEQQQISITVNALASKVPTADEILALVKQGSGIFSAQPRVVQTRFVQTATTLGDLSNAIGAEADEGAALDISMAEWRKDEAEFGTTQPWTQGIDTDE